MDGVAHYLVFGISSFLLCDGLFLPVDDVVVVVFADAAACLSGPLALLRNLCIRRRRQLTMYRIREFRNGLVLLFGAVERLSGDTLFIVMGTHDDATIIHSRAFLMVINAIIINEPEVFIMVTICNRRSTNELMAL